MQNAFCKIMINDKELGKGFFCNIQFPYKNNPMLVLIINALIMKENNNIEKELLTISLNGNRGTFIIKLDNNIIVYEDNDSNITII